MSQYRIRLKEFLGYRSQKPIIPNKGIAKAELRTRLRDVAIVFRGRRDARVEPRASRQGHGVDEILCSRNKSRSGHQPSVSAVGVLLSFATSSTIAAADESGMNAPSPLTSSHLYAAPQHVGSGFVCWTGAIGRFWPYRTEAMQARGYELRRRPLLGTSVNMPLSPGPIRYGGVVKEWASQRYYAPGAACTHVHKP